LDNSLAYVHPELIAEWSAKNAPLLPQQISYGSNKIVWWHGACGHEWQASPKSRSSGENCPICSGARVVEGINDISTLYPQIAAEWSPKNGELKPTMVSVGSHKKVIWLGSCGHEWTASVKSRVHGTGCPFCSHNLVLPGFNDLETLFPDVAAEWSDRNLPLLPSMVTAFANRKVWWKCSHGHEWNTLISTRAYGSKCPYCSGILLLKGYNDLATRHPQLAEEWSDRNFPLTPDAVNEKSQKNVWWRCKTCGYEWKSLVKSRVKGAACPACAERAVQPGYNDLATTDPELAAEWDAPRNASAPSAVSRYSKKSVWWRCPQGHEWKASIFDRAIEKTNCKICEREYHEWFPQLLVLYYAKENNLSAILDTSEITGITMDVYIPELNLAMDFSTKARIKEADIEKHICYKNGISLVHVPYNQGDSEIRMAHKIKTVLQSCHVYILSDEEEDILCVRAFFYAWKSTEKI